MSDSDNIPTLPQEIEIKDTNSSAKAMGGIMVLVAAICGIYSMLAPQFASFEQRLSFMNNMQKTEIRHLEDGATENLERIEKVRSDFGRTQQLVTSLGEKFVEVETQFSLEEKVRLAQYESLMKDFAKIERSLNEHKTNDELQTLNIRERVATLEAKIKFLEEEIKNRTCECSKKMNK